MAITPPVSQASYPLALRSFTTKKNLIQDVDASHINDMQNEIYAIQKTLGVMPNQDPTLVNTFKDNSVHNKWQTVADRIYAVQRRHDIPVVNLYRSAVQSITSDNLTGSAGTISYPSPVLDSHGIFNGSTGIRVKRPGYYQFHASLRYGQSAAKGSREMFLCRNGAIMQRDMQPNFTGSSDGSDFILQATWMGLVNPTDLITVRAYVNTEQWPTAKFTVDSVVLQGFMIRDI